MNLPSLLPTNWKKRIPQSIKIISYAVVCFVVLLPLAFIGYFQQSSHAQDLIDDLSLHLTTLIQQAEDSNTTPEIVVHTTQNHKLVLWSTYLRDNTAISRVGLIPKVRSETEQRSINLDPTQPIKPQLPQASLVHTAKSSFQILLPLKSPQHPSDRLEVGVSYASIFTNAKDAMALSGALFVIAFLFLFGTVLFIDGYISIFTVRMVSAIRSKTTAEIPGAVGLSKKNYPTFGILMEALERREGQIIDTRNTLETIFNGLQIGVAMISTETRIVLINDFYRTLIGGKGNPLTAKSLVSRAASILNLGDQFPRIEHLCSKALQTLTLESQEVLVPKGVAPSNLEDRFFVQEAYPLVDSDGDPLAIILQCRDVTSEKEAHRKIQGFNEELQAQLAVQRKQIEDANQKLLQSARLAAIGELAGGVAHEINNPNGLILAGARYVLNRLHSESNIPEFIPKYIQRIVSQSERVTHIVSSLLAFSRRRPEHKESMNIRDSIEDALDLAGARFSSKIIVQKDFPAEVPKMLGNRSQLAQVFINLFNNAVDAMPNGGAISVSIVPEAEGISVLVGDTGEGIPNGVLSKVMEPFFTTKPVGKGTGLGLSVSHGIVLEHGGTMVAQNQPEGGALFRLKFPVDGGPK